MRQFVISDHHFYHARIIELCDRPFTDVVQMNSQMITAWNSVVTPEDEVFHIGDFGFGDPSQLAVIFRQLNGARKHLIRGNHDRPKMCTQVGWTTVQTQLTLEVGGHRVLLVHRPWQDDVPPSNVEIVIHGHIHNRPTRRAHVNINVSAEVVNYLPILLDKLVHDHMRVWGWESPERFTEV